MSTAQVKPRDNRLNGVMPQQGVMTHVGTQVPAVQQPCFSAEQVMQMALVPKPQDLAIWCGQAMAGMPSVINQLADFVGPVAGDFRYEEVIEVIWRNE